MKVNKYLSITALALSLSACGDDYLNTDYNSGVTQETVEQIVNEAPETLAESYMTGIYSFMASWNSTGNDAHDDVNYMGAMIVANMTAQDVVPVQMHWFNYDYMFDNRMHNYRRTLTFWKTFYTMISNANSTIDLFTTTPENDQAKGFLGQAYAVRALAYLHLVQLYQKSNTSDPSILDLPAIPIKFATVENKEDKNGRNTVKDVHLQIESDLNTAEELLANYKRSAKHFIDLSVVKGLQARYYLLSGQWQKAADAASAARSSYSIMTNVNDGFMNISNSEWMWGYNHDSNSTTTYASFFSHMSNIAPGYAGLGYTQKACDAKLYSLIPESDVRKQWFTKEFLNVKFGDTGDWTMDYVYMRAAEMILIEAEAYAHMGENGIAAAKLKELMKYRDPSWNESSVTVDDVHLQRRIELWGEGFDYYDLKRLNKGVVRDYEGTNHTAIIDVPAGDVSWTYQIPLTELQENPEITENNP